MKAAVLTELGKPLEILTGIKIPELQRGQVLVRVAYSGVCFSQVMEARGGRGKDPFLPHLLGHEGTAVVESIGEGVQKVKKGDRVVLTWIKGEGLDAGGVKYRHNDNTINAGGVTTFNEMAVVSENRIVPLPSGIPMDVGVLFGCALLTGAGIVLNMLRPEAGSTMAVFGLGGVGLSALSVAGTFGVSKVIAVDVEAHKLSLAREFGATDVIDASVEDPVERIRAITGGAGVDYAVEAGGSTKTIEQAFQSVRKFGGLCVFASHPPSGQTIKLDPYDLICGRRIEGTWGGSSKPDRDIPLLANTYLSRKIPFEKMITKKYSLEGINEALDDLEARRAARPLIEINS